MQEQDRETRLRLLSAATRLFAERGFAKVTVRDICAAAGANVAAVNYHFRGKLGLYQEVLDVAMRTMQETTKAAYEGGKGKTPEQQLAVYVRVFLQRVVGGRHDDGWIHQLMMQELSDPTPALDMVLEQVIRPRMAYLCHIVSELLDAPVDAEPVMRCAMSVHAQCVALINPFAGRLSHTFERTPASENRTM
jgi:TetR/AcrR family transcriptional regulator, regulator of cefoperazone and chloramphenicol sensitivity